MTSLRTFCTIPLIALMLLGSTTIASASTLSFSGNFQSSSVALLNPCDSLNCEGFFDAFARESVPRFSIPGTTLRSMLVSYSLEIQAESFGTNKTDDPVLSHVSNFGSVFFSLSAEPPFNVIFVASNNCGGPGCQHFNGGVVVLPGQTVSLGLLTVPLVDARLLLPDDAGFSQLLGTGFVDLRVSGGASEHGNVCVPDRVPNPISCTSQPNLPVLAPVLLSASFAGTFDVTYTYCTQGVDPLCPVPPVVPPDPVPGPATGALLALGFAGFVGLASWERRKS